MMIDLSGNWRFYRSPAAVTDATFAESDFCDENWENVSVPHTARLETPPVNEMWQGICWYRREIMPMEAWRGRKVFVTFGAAMMQANIYLNGRRVGEHAGGYLPFCVDITHHLIWGTRNILAVRLDNRDDEKIPPGKPIKELDFCWYGGLYRNVQLQVLDPLHIQVQDAEVGIRVTPLDVSESVAKVRVQTDVMNEHATAEATCVRVALINPDGKNVGHTETELRWIPAGESVRFTCDIRVNNPRLWSMDEPNLYHAHVTLMNGSAATETRSVRFGIRAIAFNGEGFFLNGRRVYLRGVNRHQEYPYLGYALSDEAQFRDALKIKEAGFNYVRLSHYPQSPAFLDACDELGIAVLNCIPGWQFIGDDLFRERCFDGGRRLIRRDRNHPCVVAWEMSLNETAMDEAFITQMHHLAHKELAGGPCYTAGWQSGYDIFLQARQHGGCREFNDPDRACIISEYGDWEYYADNAGFAQTGYADLKPEERSSRQSRGAGEKRLLQQATNFQEAMNDNLSTRAAGDGLWVMFDYARGYAPDLETSGAMDIFRLPKFAYYLFQSQRNPSLIQPGVSSGPMVKIASHWTPKSSLNVRIFSNCQEVALYLNDQLIERRTPDTGRTADHLEHPPFTFHLANFKAGTLTAVGLMDGREVAQDQVVTPAEPVAVRLRADTSRKPLVADGSDSIFIYADIIDRNGTIVPDVESAVEFRIAGPGKLISERVMHAEAGIAPALVQSVAETGDIQITAWSAGLKSAELLVRSIPRNAPVLPERDLIPAVKL